MWISGKRTMMEIMDNKMVKDGELDFRPCPFMLHINVMQLPLANKYAL